MEYGDPMTAEEIEAAEEIARSVWEAEFDAAAGSVEPAPVTDDVDWGGTEEPF